MDENYDLKKSRRSRVFRGAMISLYSIGLLLVAESFYFNVNARENHPSIKVSSERTSNNTDNQGNDLALKLLLGGFASLGLGFSHGIYGNSLASSNNKRKRRDTQAT